MEVINNQKFKLDLHLLRVTAVISVILYHYGETINIFPNGFLGVDLFFFISGFIIPFSLKDKPIKGFKKDIAEFFKKRIVRLIPALIICIFFIGIFLALFIPTAGYSIRVGITSLFGFSNLYLLYSQSDYFANTSRLNAFLHTWSLGIEEQFYFIFAIFYFSVFQKYKKQIKLIFFISGSIFLSSFIFSTYSLNNNFDMFFYSPLSRAWEFILGWITFLIFEFTEFKSNKFFSLLGFLIILISFNLNISTNYIFKILILYLGFFLIILSKDNFFKDNRNSKIMKKLIDIGDMSYSLYLWHWPILISLILFTGKEDIFVSLIAILLTSLFSGICFKYIETPLRKSKKLIKFTLKKIMLYLGITLTFFTIILAYSARNLKGLFYKNEYNLISGYSEFISCSDKGIYEMDDICIRKANKLSKKNLYLLGDSHALHYVHAIINSFQDFNIIINTQSGTPFPGILISKKKNKPEIFNKEFFEKQLNLEKYLKLRIKENDLLIVSNYYQRYFGDSNTYNKTTDFYHFDEEQIPITKDKNLQNWEKKWNNLIEIIKAKRAKLLIIKASPELNNSFTLPQHCLPNFFNKEGGSHSGCDINILEYKESYRKVDKLLMKLKIKFPDTVFFIDPLNYFCSEDICKIYSKEIDNSILFDAHHITKEASLLIKPALIKFKYQNFN